MKNSLKTQLQVLTVNVVIGMICILMIELFFGNWFKTDRLNILNIIRNQTMWTSIPSLYDDDETLISYHRDQYGLRGSYRSTDQIDILTIGGSTTDQKYVADGKTWQDVLQRMFADDGHKVYVVNAGIDGQSSVGHIKNFELWFPKMPNLSPRYILFYIGINDLFVLNQTQYDSFIVDQAACGLSCQIQTKSALYNLWRTIYGNYLSNNIYHAVHQKHQFADYKWTDRPVLQNHDSLVRDRLDAYRNRLSLLIRYTHKMNAIPIFVTQGTRFYIKKGSEIYGTAHLTPYAGKMVNGVDLYYFLRAINKTTIDTCRQSRGICIDLESEVSFDDDDMYDLFHTTPKGSIKIADTIYSHLKNAYR